MSLTLKQKSEIKSVPQCSIGDTWTIIRRSQFGIDIVNNTNPQCQGAVFCFETDINEFFEYIEDPFESETTKNHLHKWRRYEPLMSQPYEFCEVCDEKKS